MKYKFTGLTFREKMFMIFRLLFNAQLSYKKSFLKYHLIRRKYIVSKACEVFGKDKFEPAPLLNKKFLDVGAGINQISDEIAFRGADILAIDDNLEILTAAKNSALHQGSPVEYRHIKYKDLPEDRKFDAIMFLDFLSNDNIKNSLEKAQRMLNKNGVIIISGSNRTFKSYIRNILIPKFLLKMFHLNIGSKDLIKLKKIKKELKKIGFVLQDVQGIDFSFYAGKWHKTRSTRVRYMLHCVEESNPINKIEQTK